MSNNSPVIFTAAELAFMSGCPEVLRALAMYHEVRAQDAESQGCPVVAHQERRQELLVVAEQIEADL